MKKVSRYKSLSISTDIDKYDYNLTNLEGPAVEYASGGYEWFKDGKWHRRDGPAIVLPTNKKPHVEWWVDGNDITKEMEELCKAIDGDPFNISMEDHFYYANMISSVIQKKGFKK